MTLKTCFWAEHINIKLFLKNPGLHQNIIPGLGVSPNMAKLIVVKTTSCINKAEFHFIIKKLGKNFNFYK